MSGGRSSVCAEESAMGVGLLVRSQTVPSSDFVGGSVGEILSRKSAWPAGWNHLQILYSIAALQCSGTCN